MGYGNGQHQAAEGQGDLKGGVAGHVVDNADANQSQPELARWEEVPMTPAAEIKRPDHHKPTVESHRQSAHECGKEGVDV